MKTINILLPALLAITFVSKAQNDVDAIRYSRNGVGGTSRFTAMGGAFGAVGADLSCASSNPAGLALFRKGELSFSGGLKFTNNNAKIYNKSSNISDASFVFNNFGLSMAFAGANDDESRHIIAFSNTQLQNFNSSVRMSGYTKNSSIAKDMLILANEAGNVDNLNYGYEGLGFNTFILDTADDGSFFSFVDTKRSVKQTRDVVTSGRVNDINISYAYSAKDKYYFGASVGFPQVNYISTTRHTESDDRDSMRVTVMSSTTYSTTYVDDLPAIYPDKLGFNDLTYTEYFKTTGSGVNLKLGGIARLNDAIRLGFYYHTPTVYRLTDNYYNALDVTFDTKKNNAISDQYPAAEDGGYFEYKVVTPQRFSLNSAFLFNKLAVVGFEYELVDYSTAQLKSDRVSDFADINSAISSKYTIGNNVRLGTEFNLKPFMLRAGYNMQGSPFGAAFVGDFVRNTFSFGAGFRTENNFYIDLVWSKTLGAENYYSFTTLDTKTRINYNSANLGLTMGVKF